MSTLSLPVSAFFFLLLRPALRTWSRLTLMDNPSSLCAQHAIWCAVLTDRGMEGQFAMLSSKASGVERNSSKALCPFTCLLVILSAQHCQGLCAVDHTLFQRLTWVYHTIGVKGGWAIRSTSPSSSSSAWDVKLTEWDEMLPTADESSSTRIYEPEIASEIAFEFICFVLNVQDTVR